MYSNIMFELQTNIVNLPRLTIPTAQILNFAADYLANVKNSLTTPGKEQFDFYNACKKNKALIPRSTKSLIIKAP